MNKFMQICYLILSLVLTLRIAAVYVKLWDLLSLVGWALMLALVASKLAAENK